MLLVDAGAWKEKILLASAPIFRRGISFESDF
jgi:hypothetical protein